VLKPPSCALLRLSRAFVALFPRLSCLVRLVALSAPRTHSATATATFDQPQQHRDRDRATTNIVVNYVCDLIAL